MRIAIVVLILSAGFATATEPCSPAECQRRARAAFAFAKLKSPGANVGAAVPVAPAPHGITSALRSKCVCGDKCECADGTCPAKCPVKPKSEKVEPKTTAAPAPRYEYRQICVGGVCSWQLVEVRP